MKFTRFFLAALIALVAIASGPPHTPVRSALAVSTAGVSSTPAAAIAGLGAAAGEQLLSKFASSAHAAAMTDYLENKLADHLFRTTTYSQPAAIYVRLLTSNCTDSSAGTEVTGGSYARVQLNPGNANWKGTHGSTSGVSSGTNGTISNASAITFPSPTANWSVVTGFALNDASTSGNDLFCAALTVSKTINNGDAAPSFAIDALTVQFDN